MVALLAGLMVVVTVAALKWVIVGRYRTRVEPLWNTFVRRTELVTGLYESAAVPALLAGLTGTPMLGVDLARWPNRTGAGTSNRSSPRSPQRPTVLPELRLPLPIKQGG